MRIYALLTNRHYTIMSLFKSITKLAKVSYKLAKEDKQFRKESAIAAALFPIYTSKVTLDAIDLTVGATKYAEKVCDKLDSAIHKQEIESMYPGVKIADDVIVREFKV